MMIERALKLRQALHNLASSDRDLSKYLLSDDEWNCIVEIHELLQVCNLLTIFILKFILINIILLYSILKKDLILLLGSYILLLLLAFQLIILY